MTRGLGVVHVTTEGVHRGWRQFDWLLAAGAFAASAWYLAGGMPHTLINLTVAGLVLAVPMALTSRSGSTLVAPVVWLGVGLMPLGYVFGVFVALAGVAGVLAHGVRSLGRRLWAAPAVEAAGRSDN